MLRKMIANGPNLAVDIGSYSVKICALNPHRGYAPVDILTEMPTPPDCVREGTVIAPEQLGQGLRVFLQSHHLRPKTASLTVGGPQVVARPVRLPKMPVETLRKSIQYEASRYLPTASEDHFVGFEVLNEIGDQMEILIVAAPRDVVESRVQTLHRAGIEAEIVEVEAFTLQRAIALTVEPAEPDLKSIALIDLGGTHTQVSVLRGQTLALTRYVPIAGETFAAALKGYFHYSPEEAEQIKRELNVAELLQKGADPQENPPLRLLQPIMDELIREIRRSLNYYQSQMTEEGSAHGRVERLLVTGGTALMNGITDYLQHKLNLPTEVVNPLQSALLDTSKLSEAQIAQGPLYANVLGSACVSVAELAKVA